MRWFLLIATLALGAGVLSAAPVVFWASDGVGPGDAVLAYGGPLAQADGVLVWRLPDGASAQPNPGAAALTPPRGLKPVPALQPSAQSVKFIMPQGQPGVYAFAVNTPAGRSAPYLLNAPRPRFIQPKELKPGLAANEAYPGAGVQIVGTNFSPPDGGGQFRVALRGADGRWRVLKTPNAEKYSVEVQLPADLPCGKYELWTHLGHGGAAAWGGPLRISVKQPEVWPDKIFNVRSFGAKGDDVTDDTAAVKAALEAARKNGGGVVYVPWGTYRISGWIFLPPHVTLRGENRETTWLKWPMSSPKDANDVAKAAVYGAGSYAVENLSFAIRNADIAFRDLSYDAVHRRLYNFPVPEPELAAYMLPFGEERDVFLRNVRVQHLYLCGRPAPEFYDRYEKRIMCSFACGGIRNFQVTDCDFTGTQRMLNMDNGRVERCSFSNQFGSSWTDLGGRYVVFQNNNIRGASSWRWSGNPLEYLYSAHNVSYNQERGEREAMTFDVNGLPCDRTGSYWGYPIEVGNQPGNVYLKFLPPDQTSPDGSATGFPPHFFTGGEAVVHAYEGGPGKGQTRKVLDSTADTVTLDKPWDTPPGTTPRKGYLEVRTPASEAWSGAVSEAAGTRVLCREAGWRPGGYAGKVALVADGPGLGQYRDILANTADTLTVDRPWDVPLTAQSKLLIFQLMRHAIVYDCEGYDTSAFSQLWGNFYDFTVDGCRVQRDQGIWALSGWFVQFVNNRLSVAQSYHPGIGAGGNNPEGCAPLAPVGFIPAGHVYDLKPPIPSVVAGVLRGNQLDYNHRLALQAGYQFLAPKALGYTVFTDVLVDRNLVQHSPVGIQVDPNVSGVLLSGNRFREVAQPYLLAAPEKVLVREATEGALPRT